MLGRGEGKQPGKKDIHTVYFHFYVFLENTHKSVVQKADQWWPGDGVGAGVERNRVRNYNAAPGNFWGVLKKCINLIAFIILQFNHKEEQKISFAAT